MMGAGWVSFDHDTKKKTDEAWSANAIRANYDYMDTNRDDHYILFFYVLENTTDRDYRVEAKDGISLTSKLAKQQSLSPFNEYEKIQYPIFIPSKQRLRFRIEIPYPYMEKKEPTATWPKQNRSRRASTKDLEEYARTQFKNLDGFVLFDSNNRYEINFPKGW